VRAWLIAVVVWVVSAAILAPVCFFATMLLAGPHSSILPGFLQPVVLLLGWIAFLVAPIRIARAAWRRAGRGRAVA
jgi:hypothetical protein